METERRAAVASNVPAAAWCRRRCGRRAKYGSIPVFGYRVGVGVAERTRRTGVGKRSALSWDSRDPI